MAGRQRLCTDRKPADKSGLSSTGNYVTEKVRLTMAQALVRYLLAQRSIVDGVEEAMFAGVFAIFGHGNVAGLGEALQGCREQLPVYRAHNE